MRSARPHSPRASRASRRSQERLPRCTRSPRHGTRMPFRSRSGSRQRPSVSSPRRELLRVAGAEPIGPYTLLRIDRGGVDPGAPGQFFMLEAPGRLLPRPMSLCLAPPGELAFVIAPLPYLSWKLDRPPAILGFRSEWHAEAAALVPNAEVVIDPVLVTHALPAGRNVLACGPEPMLEAVR